MVQLSLASEHFVRVVTCVLVPALADTRCRVGRGAVAPGKKQGCTFHCEEALTDTRREKRKAASNTGTYVSYLIMFGVCVTRVFINVSLNV